LRAARANIIEKVLRAKKKRDDLPLEGGR